MKRYRTTTGHVLQVVKEEPRGFLMERRKSDGSAYASPRERFWRRAEVESLIQKQQWVLVVVGAPEEKVTIGQAASEAVEWVGDQLDLFGRRS